MFRLILIFLAMLVTVRLVSILIRSIKIYSRGSVTSEKRDKEVGEGWIVEDRMDEEEKD